jgi:hypothetical protein
MELLIFGGIALAGLVAAALNMPNPPVVFIAGIFVFTFLGAGAAQAADIDKAAGGFGGLAAFGAGFGIGYLLRESYEKRQSPPPR